MFGGSGREESVLEHVMGVFLRLVDHYGLRWEAWYTVVTLRLDRMLSNMISISGLQQGH